MRLSHRRKLAHKKGTYCPRLTYSLLRHGSSKWHKAFNREFERTMKRRLAMNIKVGEAVDPLLPFQKFHDAVCQFVRALANALNIPALVGFLSEKLNRPSVTGHDGEKSKGGHVTPF